MGSNREGLRELADYCSRVAFESVGQKVPNDVEDYKEGMKFDDGKLRWDLLPFEAVEEVVKVYTFGAHKYADENWREGIKYKRIIGAIFRHLTAWIMGKNKDKESGLDHLAHAGWGILTLIWYEKHRKEFDDRWHNT